MFPVGTENSDVCPYEFWECGMLCAGEWRAQPLRHRLVIAFPYSSPPNPRVGQKRCWVLACARYTAPATGTGFESVPFGNLCTDGVMYVGVNGTSVIVW